MKAVAGTAADVQVHLQAIVDPGAELAAGVNVGPWTLIGPDVKIGPGTVVGPGVLIERNTTVGADCEIHKGAVLGTPPQDLKFRGEDSRLVVGDRTVIREYATLNRGTSASGLTAVGDDCLLMAYTHVAHDCRLGNHVILSNAVNMAGHVELHDWAIVGGLTPIHQFVRIGIHAFIGGGLPHLAGRLAVLPGGREPTEAVRVEHGRARAAGLPGRDARRAEEGLPDPLPVRSQRVAGARAGARGSGASARGRAPLGLHPGLRARNHNLMGERRSPLRLGVAGVGSLGFHHARIARELPGVTLSGFHDPRADRADKVVSQLGIRFLPSLPSLLGEVEALVVATPTTTHADVACAALDRGVHVFIEKPIASDLAQADRILEAASRTGARVQVGHVERFNTALVGARPYLEAPLFIESHRLAPFTERGTDVAVVLDLMIHDVDLVASLVRQPVVSFEATGIPVLTPSVDIANARITFDGRRGGQPHGEPRVHGAHAEAPDLPEVRIPEPEPGERDR